MEELKRLAERCRGDKKLLAALSLGLLALLLVLLGGSGGTKTETKTARSADTQRRAVEEALETRLTKLLASVEAVGRLRVVVTVDALEEAVFVREGENGDSVVLVGENGAKQGLVSRVLSPAVRGVAVVCEGGGSAAVRREVSALVCAALGVGANRVYVGKMETP